jgi:hypothetical protein
MCVPQLRQRLKASGTLQVKFSFSRRSRRRFRRALHHVERSEREVDICTRSLGSGWLTRDGLRFCLLSYSFSFADGLSGFTADPGRAGDSLLVDSDTLPGEPSLMEPDIPEAPPVLPNVTPSFAAVC